MQCARSGENRRQSRDRSIHQTGQAGLHDLEHEETPVRFVFFPLDVGTQLLLSQFVGPVFVRAFFLREIVEQLAHSDILSPAGRSFIKPAALHLQRAGLVAHHIQAQRADQPHGLARNEPLHVLPTDERNVLAEALPVQLEQPAPVARFFAAHAVENGSRGRKVLPEAFGVVGVDALILFFE